MAYFDKEKFLLSKSMATSAGLVGIILGVIFILGGLGLLIWGFLRSRNPTEGLKTGTTLTILISGAVLFLIGIIILIFGIADHQKISKMEEMKTEVQPFEFD